MVGILAAALLIFGIAYHVEAGIHQGFEFAPEGYTRIRVASTVGWVALVLAGVFRMFRSPALALRLLAIGVVALAPSAGVSIAQMRYRFQASDAKAYCESLVPEIESERARTGQFPERLAPDRFVSDPETQVPELLERCATRGYDVYSGHGDSFRFSVLDQVWWSDTRTWDTVHFGL